MKSQLYEFVQSTDRWTNRAVSPLKFDDEDARSRPIVIVHPGWGKRPEIHAKLLHELDDAGMWPIGVDTRYGYSNQGASTGYRLGAGALAMIRQPFKTGLENPFFAARSEEDNRYRLRRPTGLAALCRALRIHKASLVGHSEGGRITTTVAAESDVLVVPQLIVVNSVGTGDSDGGLGRMVKSNTGSNYVLDGSIDLRQGVRSAVGSGIYAATHPLRFSREKQVIQEADIWPMLGKVSTEGTQVTRMHALDDMLVDYGTPESAVEQWPNISLVATTGGHSNVYGSEVRGLIVNLLAA